MIEGGCEVIMGRAGVLAYSAHSEALIAKCRGFMRHGWCLSLCIARRDVQRHSCRSYPSPLYGLSRECGFSKRRHICPQLAIATHGLSLLLFSFVVFRLALEVTILAIENHPNESFPYWASDTFLHLA